MKILDKTKVIIFYDSVGSTKLAGPYKISFLYLDFAKALVKDDHNILIIKLGEFLRNMKFRVVVNEMS